MVDFNYVFELQLKNNRKCDQVKAKLKHLILDDATIDKVTNIFKSEIANALAEKPSSLQMENTYIPELPDGTEEGIFLALDLGGTNFRAILLEIMAGEIVREEVKRYHISDELRVGCGVELFDYLAECLTDFVVEQGLEDVPLPLGFTFSFPMKQHSLNSGSLVTWTKSFNCPDVVNRDVVRLLCNSLKRRGHNNIDVVAILNDTTGTVIQGARMDSRTRIGIVVGTGSNACYVENADNVQHWETERHGEKMVIIDIEWGAFGDNGTLDFLKTEFDRVLDSRSLLVNSFTFEKYIGGKYLGELARSVLEVLVELKLFMSNAPANLFPQPWTFPSTHISSIEQDTIDGNNIRIKEILGAYNYVYQSHYDDDDIEILKYVAALISYRAAVLVSITTSVLLNRMDENNITIAIDGSVYKHHPRLNGWLQYLIRQRVPNKMFRLMLAEDGSGKGAGLAAAIALRVRNKIS